MTLPHPQDISTPLQENVTEREEDPFLVNEDSITLSQAFGAPIALVLQEYYNAPSPAPTPDGAFDSDDEYHEFKYRKAKGSKTKVTCIAQELYHAEVEDLRTDPKDGKARSARCNRFQR